MYPILIALSIASFWLFSPESLVLIGNGGGGRPGIGILVLLVLSVVMLLSVFLVDHDQTKTKDSGKYPGRTKFSFTQIFGLSGIVGTAVFAPTGILVTAGFTFNEVFFYRFPNFAFAYLLLIFVLGLQFFSIRVRSIVLGTSVLLCFGGLLFLTLSGLMTKPAAPVTHVSENIGLQIYLPLLLVFAGIDQIHLILRDDKKRFYLAFLVSIILLAGWMFVSARFVESERLISSTIPYMTAAARIAGNSGRLIVGMVVIFGSITTVYWLLNISSGYVQRILAHQSRIASGSSGRLIFVLLSVIIGTLMGTGVAGTTHLELYIRCSILLWLIHMAMGRFSFALKYGSSRSIQTGISMISGIILLLGSLTLFLHQKELLLTVIFTISMIATTVVLITVANTIFGNSGLRKTNIINDTEV